MRLLAESGADLIVTADCGITDADEVALAAELGVDTIVTDHHSPPERLPDAAAVVNPKLPGQPETYRDLASCGVAYKLMEALYEHGGKDLGESLLGLAALGTIADMAPLTAGNRTLGAEGLAALNRAEDAGIKALIEVSGIGPGRVDSEAVSFALAPRINAPGRMGHAEDGYKLLTAESEEEAAALAKALDEKNLERRTATAAIIDKVMEQRSAFESRPIIILGDAEFPPGVVGLAAGRLTDQYYRPAVVCTTGPEETRGSCRSIPEFDMIEGAAARRPGGGGHLPALRRARAGGGIHRHRGALRRAFRTSDGGRGRGAAGRRARAALGYRRRGLARPDRRGGDQGPAPDRAIRPGEPSADIPGAGGGGAGGAAAGRGRRAPEVEDPGPGA